jgi:hypothetical protein
MKVFLKWYFGSILFLLAMTFLPVMLTDHGKLHYFEGFVFILIGSFVLASLFYYLQIRFIPKRKERLMNRIIDVFGAYPIDETTTRIYIGNLSVYTQINIQLALSEHHGYTETIQFHVPREQIDLLSTKSSLNLKKSHCDSIQTYLVYEASSWRLKQAKRILDKKVGEIIHLPLT